MELLILIVLGLSAGWLVFRSMQKAAKEGKCANCPDAKGCQKK